MKKHTVLSLSRLMPFLLLCLGLPAMPQQLPDSHKKITEKQAMPDDIFDKGMFLSPAEVGKLEASLRLHPDDTVVRTQLLGYYLNPALSSSGGHAKFLTHLEWTIRHHPESEILRSRCCGLMDTNPAECARFERLWEAQIKLHKEDARVYANAAWFLHFSPGITDLELPVKEDQDTVQVVLWLQEAQRLDSRNPEWPEGLGQIYQWRMDASVRNHLEAKVRESGKLALQYFERAFQLTREENSRSSLWENMAMVAYEAGEYDKAEEYAVDLLKPADVPTSKDEINDREHYANMILGRLALKDGEVKDAETYLLASGYSVGHRTQIFGPQMALAEDLLAQGRTDAVLSYLEICGTFWKKAKIDQWIRQIKEGQTPDFGVQRFY